MQSTSNKNKLYRVNLLALTETSYTQHRTYAALQSPSGSNRSPWTPHHPKPHSFCSRRRDSWDPDSRNPLHRGVTCCATCLLFSEHHYCSLPSLRNECRQGLPCSCRTRAFLHRPANLCWRIGGRSTGREWSPRLNPRPSRLASKSLWLRRRRWRRGCGGCWTGWGCAESTPGSDCCGSAWNQWNWSMRWAVR